MCAYRGRLGRLEQWCAQQNLCPLPASPLEDPGVVAGACRGATAATLHRQQTAISKPHAAASLPSAASLTHVPAQDTLLLGPRCTHDHPSRQCAALDRRLAGYGLPLRCRQGRNADRALLRQGCVRDLLVTVRHCKPNQTAAGRKFAIGRRRHLGVAPIRLSALT